MRPPGTPAELERRRRLAVRRLQAGYSVAQVAAFLEVDPSSVRRWRGAFQRQGKRALRARRGAGRPPKLSATQAKIVRRWLRAPASEQGFATELWTGARLAWLLEAEFGVRLTPAHLSVWLRARGLTPQKPARVPRERDPQAIARWLEADWPRIKKRPAARERAWCSSTRAAS
jgi:transposase